MKDNIILIGFMGAGKTSIGNCWSEKKGRPFLDTDLLIEQEAGMSIPGIFKELGEERFREIESAVLQKLDEKADHMVISVGGGLPLKEENRAVLTRLGTVVFLRVKPDTVLKRLAKDTSRPLLQAENKAARIQQLLTVRNPVYEQAAHLVIDADDKDPEQIIMELEAALPCEGKIRRQS